MTKKINIYLFYLIEMINICADTANRKICVMSEYIFSSNTFGDLHLGFVS